MTQPVHRVLLVEDDPRVRAALELIVRESAFECALVGSGAEALRRVGSFAPDACVVDLGLPDMAGDALIRELRGRWPEMPVVVLTVATSKTEILGAFRAGAIGYLFKEDVAAHLPAAIREALAGGAPMSRRVARMVLGELHDPSPPSSKVRITAAPTSVSALTGREIEVLESLSRGLSYSDVATCLDISQNTVRTHVRSIYEKLEVASKTEAVLEAIRLGVLSDHTS